MDQDDKPTIDNMPDEVLVEIFSFFSPKLLKISALVCSRFETKKLLFRYHVLTILLFRWNNLIGQTPELMKNFRLNLVPRLSDHPNLPASIAALTRGFQNLKIDYLDGAVPEILHKLNNIHTLEISRSFIRRQELVDALAGMKHLNTFKADKLQLDDNGPDAAIEAVAIEPVKLSKLKYISLHDCFEDILTLLSTTTLETIEITNYKWKAVSAYENNLVKKLLMDQPALQSLSLHQADINNILENDVDHKFPFSLHSFKTSPPLISSIEAWSEAFTKFIKLHKDTLKTFVLKDFSLLDETEESFLVLVLALNSLPNLESLGIPFNISHTHSKDLQPFAKVTRFSTQRFTISPENSKAFVRLFPAVDTLQVELFFESKAESIEWFLKYISRELPWLKELAIPSFASFASFYSQNFEKLKFKNLKAIKVRSVRSSHNFPAFIERHADTLESLEICIDSESHSVNPKPNRLINAIQSCTKLKRISLMKPNPISLFKNKISLNHPWTLETRISACYFKCGIYLQPVAFKFPDDEALFQDKCTTCDEDLIRKFNFYDCCKRYESKMDC